MKAKIGNTIYDADQTPIMIILSDHDKEQLLSMPEQFNKYVAAPKNSNIDELKKWMNSENSESTNSDHSKISEKLSCKVCKNVDNLNKNQICNTCEIIFE